MFPGVVLRACRLDALTQVALFSPPDRRMCEGLTEKKGEGFRCQHHERVDKPQGRAQQEGSWDCVWGGGRWDRREPPETAGSPILAWVMMLRKARHVPQLQDTFFGIPAMTAQQSNRALFSDQDANGVTMTKHSAAPASQTRTQMHPAR